MPEKSKNTAPKEKGGFNIKSKAVWTVLFLVIAALSIWAVTSQAKDFTFSAFYEFIATANPLWLCSAVASMLCFIIFEGLALLVICKAFGYGRSFGRGFVYSAGDIYFSAITPSATGGQPASAFFMMKDGIPGTFVTVALVVNLVMYTASIVALGLLAVLFTPGMFFNFTAGSKLLIIIGFIMQIGLLIFFIMLLTQKRLITAICGGTIKLLAKIKIIKKVDKALEKVNKKIDNYSSYTAHIKGKGAMLLVVFIFNLIQRFAQIAVTPLSYLAAGGDLGEAVKVLFTQIYVVVGSNCIPIPGAMGVTDYLMLDGFENLNVANPGFLELLSRSLSFYVCIIICGLTVLFSYLALSKKKRRMGK